MRVDAENSIRVSNRALPPGQIVRGQEGFMKLNMELDFVNRSTNSRKCAVVAKSLGTIGFGYIDGTASTFMRKREHLADGRDLISINISGGGRFKVEGVRGLDHYERGGAVVLESRRESTLHSLDDTSAWTICMERAPIEPLLAGIHEPIQRCVAADNPGIRLLEGYLTCSSRSIRTATSRSQHCMSVILRSMHWACAATRRRWCANAASRPQDRALFSKQSRRVQASLTSTRRLWRRSSACRRATCINC